MSMRKEGKRTLADSFRDASRGIRHCLQTERNMRVHVLAAVLVTVLALCLGVSRGEFACLLLAMGMVMAAEAMNTAVERLCDFIQKSPNQLIGTIKDIAAGSVLLAAVFAAAVGVAVFLPHLFRLIQFIQRII